MIGKKMIEKKIEQSIKKSAPNLSQYLESIHAHLEVKLEELKDIKTELIKINKFEHHLLELKTIRKELQQWNSKQ